MSSILAGIVVTICVTFATVMIVSLYRSPTDGIAARWLTGKAGGTLSLGEQDEAEWARENGLPVDPHFGYTPVGDGTLRVEEEDPMVEDD